MDAIENFQHAMAGPLADVLQRNWLVVALVLGFALYLVFVFGFRADTKGGGDDGLALDADTDGGSSGGGDAGGGDGGGGD